MKVLFAAAILMLSLAACEKRTVPQGGTAAPPADSSASDTTRSVTDSTAKSSGQAPIIGHDSAFGPIGAIDDSGKLVPVPVRRP